MTLEMGWSSWTALEMGVIVVEQRWGVGVVIVVIKQC